MNISRIVTSCSAAALLLASLPGNADFGGHFSFISQFSDNAERAPDGELSEWQDKYALGLEGDYENDLIAVEAGYTASMHRYEKASQPRRELLEGNSSLRIGKETQIFDVEFIHSRQTLLNAPDAVDLLVNNDERQLLAAIPTFRAILSSVDNVMLQGNFAKTDYRYAEERNSEAEGASIIWQHKFSPVDVGELSVQKTKITFDAAPDSDYEYEAVLAGYSTMLRQVKYSLVGGYNQSSRENGDEFTGPVYSAELDYTTGNHRLTLFVNQKITDTSMGDGNHNGINLDFESRDVGGTGIDMIKRRSLELRWEGKMLCERCDLSASIHVRDDDYFELAEDNKEQGISLSAGYRISPAARVGLRASRREQRFDDNTLRDEHTLDQIRADYVYSFINGVSVSVFALQQERSSQSKIRDYQETISGLSLSYNF